jgi:hypothetical protein
MIAINSLTQAFTKCHLLQLRKNMHFQKLTAITCPTLGLCNKTAVILQRVTSTRTEPERRVNLYHFSLLRNLIKSGNFRQKSASKLDVAFQDTNWYIRREKKKKPTHYVPSRECGIHLSWTVIFVRRVTTPSESTSEAQHYAQTNFLSHL